MKSNKEINRAVNSLLGNQELYDVRECLQLIQRDLSKDEAEAAVDMAIKSGSNAESLTIVSSLPDDFAGDMTHALYAAQRIAERNQCHFVLSLEDGVWKAAFGNWGDCAEYKGSNPAHVTCVSILKFMGKM